MTDDRLAQWPGGRLEARGVTVRFQGLTALDDVTLALARGEILGLIGPNGAGKTTLVNALSGFQPLTAGSIRLGGRDISGWPPHRIGRAGLGRTFQAVRLFGAMDVLENVELGAVAVGMTRRAARRRALEVLDWLGLADKAAEPALALPYGQERWVGVARALAGRPDFLLLDEPAAGLNEVEADQLMRAIAGIRDEFGCGVLVIEHNMALIMALCDRLHVLAQGRTIAAGTPTEMQNDPAVRAAYLGDAEPAALPARARPALATARDRDLEPTDPQALLSVERLTVRYGQVTALRNVSIHVEAGELVSVVGPNGAGKSTLLHAIAGLVAPETGSIRFDGAVLPGRRVERIVAGGISLVPEGRHVFPALTVAENLSIGGTPRGGVAPAELERVLELFPVLRERQHTAAGKLSGGEQQQLAIARALLARPRLLLLDEPSLGLAPRVIELVYQALARLTAEGLTILLVEQSAARALAVADRTYVLRSGAVELTGRSDELAAHPEFEEAYFGFRRSGAVA